MSDSEETFQTLRAYLFYSSYKFLLNEQKDLIKDEVLWNIKKGQALTIDKLQNAEEKRYRIYQKTLSFFDDHDFLITPSSVTVPFDINQPWVKSVEGKELDNYVSWLMIAACVSLTNCPSVAISTSFSKQDAPIGIQIIAAPHNEKKLLGFAKTIEDAINISSMVPKESV